jgi:hypothetical protein
MIFTLYLPGLLNIILHAFDTVPEESFTGFLHSEFAFLQVFFHFLLQLFTLFLHNLDRRISTIFTISFQAF